jgi:hypothetical protein
LIREALRQNYDVAIAAARVQEARAQLRVARSDLYPSLNYGVGVSYSKVGPGIQGQPGGPVPNANDFYSATMSASWEIDIWGRVRRLNEAARANLFATEDARRGVWLTLVSDLGQAYFELLALDVRLAIARNSTDAYQRTYDLFLDRFEHGVASGWKPRGPRARSGKPRPTFRRSRVTSSPRRIRSAFSWESRPVPSLAAGRCTSSRSRRQCRWACPRRSWNGGPTCARPRSSS